ncbi:hypothetical protein AB0C07_07645 [Actinoplanes missouriensis]|uniref:hypothetical protein n=1 Tax=Actinoplanes missouriensis TaxID=1866 RepID=UPI0033F571AA
MTSRRLGRGLLSVLLASVVLNLATAGRVEADDKDGDVVYCLSSAQRAALVETAVILRPSGPPPLSASAPPGAPDSLETWRVQDGPAFTRACAALIGAAQVTAGPRTSSPGPIRTMLTVLLPAVTGAVLTWLFATQLAARNARRTQAIALRAAKRQFDLEAQSLIDRRAAQDSGPMPRADGLRAARVDLVNHLEEIAAWHRDWNQPRAVRRLLEGRNLADRIEDVRYGVPQETVEDARSTVRDVLTRVEPIAVAVERPRREDEAMRRADDAAPRDAGALPAGSGSDGPP